jgi:hypothetical protein
MARPPRGGASNIHGILYQMLWCLLRAAKIRFMAPLATPVDQHHSVRLLLEPRGGGDVQLINSNQKQVVQIKTRGDLGTWSLRELIDEILPDLYQAVNLKDQKLSYLFLTDGRRGRWAEVEAFFKSLAAIGEPETADVTLDLDDTAPFRFGGDTDLAYWHRPAHSQRSLFLHIADALGAHD